MVTWKPSHLFMSFLNPVKLLLIVTWLVTDWGRMQMSEVTLSHGHMHFTLCTGHATYSQDCSSQHDVKSSDCTALCAEMAQMVLGYSHYCV